MPVKPLELDDRTFADLFAEVRSLIPRHAPGWTDHNVSDPGIMLLELFTWLTEAMLYRINRVSDASRVRLLTLLGAAFQPAQPALLKLRARWTQPDVIDRYVLPRATRVWAQAAASGRVPFEVTREVEFTAQEPVRTVILRQTQKLAAGVLARPAAGRPCELIPLGKEYLVPPPEPRPRCPQVMVNNEPWTVVDALRVPSANGHRVALKPWLNAVAFGDGSQQTGDIPPPGATIQVTYRWAPAPRAVVMDTFRSTGQPWQVFRLTRRFIGLDFAEPGDLEPQLEVQEITDGPWHAWEYVTNYLDMTAGASQYTFEPWANAIRCGDGRYGRAPAPAAGLRLTGRVTLGAGGNLPREAQFAGWPVPGSSAASQAGLSVESWESCSPGSSPTALDEARVQVLAMLRPDWRAVTADDFVSVIRKQIPDIARVICLPGHTPSDTAAAPERPGYVGIITIPDRAIELTASSRDLSYILATSTQSRRLVAADEDGATWLWNLETGEPLRLQPPDATTAMFSRNGRRVLVLTQDSPADTAEAVLWDALDGRLIRRVVSGLLSGPGAGFSPAGRWWVTHGEDGAQLRELEDGVTAHLLPGVCSWAQLAFGPGDAALAAASGGAVQLWDVMGEGQRQDLLPSGPAGMDSCTAIAFSASGSGMAAAAADGRVVAWQLRGAPAKTMDVMLPPGGPATSLLFNAAGTRLVTRSAGGSAALWSVRTGARLADLSAASPVDLLAISSDGRWLATAHADQAICAWDAATGIKIGELTRGRPVAALAFAPDRPRIITLTTAPETKYTLEAWSLHSDVVRALTVQEIDGSSPPVIHTSGRWLAYADERLVHVWDITRAADITAIYADFDDPTVLLDDWRLGPVDNLPRTAIGLQAAAAAPIALTALRHLRIISAPAPSSGGSRTAQLWDAEHVYAAADLLTTRRLVTTRTEVAGPTYAGVTVHVIVVRRLPTIDPARLEKDIRVALSRFFDPLHGGPDGVGWPLGRPVYTSEICQIVEAVDGVDHVERVSPIAGQIKDPEQLDIPVRSLVKYKIIVQVR